ncbi:hypothetical protein HYW87_04945 [Candidatus Roizmanbacteria bacterium]|nr:hypothetical protein [Candidatus Roizmanbacteria bacterium]
MDPKTNLVITQQFVRRLIKKAGKILKNYFYSDNIIRKEKAGVDFTTEADQEVDKFLQSKIKSRYVKSNFLTEETAPKDYSSLSDTENLWVIDPLDGTINFSRKHPNFSISIALMHKGEIILGTIYVPLEDKLYEAMKNREGSYLNNKRIYTSETSALRETVIACDWAWDLEKRKNVIRWIEYLSGQIRQVKSMGSAAADLASLAEGKIDAYIHSGLKPWDVAAAGIIIPKADGIITLPNGSTWSPFDSDILASNGILNKKMLELI